jgi:tetratricopeptide (TPR) repeat protein
LAFHFGCYQRKPSESDGSELFDLRARSIALLENNADTDKKGVQLNLAAEGFRKITEKSPRDALGRVNLCIALLSRIKLTDPVESDQEYSKLCQEFESTIESLRTLMPTDPSIEILTGRYYLQKNERDAAMQCFRKAIKLPNAGADAYFQLIELLRTDSDTAHESEIRQLLDSSVKLAPDNLVLAVSYLEALAKNQDVAFLSEAERCRALFAPLISRTNSVLLTLLDRSIEAFKKSDSKTTQTQTAFIKNLMLREIAYQNDRNMLDPHLLDYVRLRPETSEAPKRVLNRSRSQAVFAAPAKPLAMDSATDTKAIAVEDFDLDSHRDLILATKDQVQAWSLANGKVESMITQSPIDIDVVGMALADLDHDYQYRKDELPDSALPSALPPDTVASEYSKWVDTDVDLVLYGKQGVRLFRNELDANTKRRTLVPVTLVGDMGLLSDVQAVAVIDFDHDSDLDLVFSSQQGITLWSNRGDWTFADFTSYSSLPAPTTRFQSILAMDLDRNVLNDFLLAGTNVSLQFLDNNLHGRYKTRDQNWGKQLSSGAHALEAIDANGDACWDLLLGGPRGTELITMKSVGHHGWTQDQIVTISSVPVRGLAVSDVDWDGFSDAVAWGEQGVEVFYGANDGLLRGGTVLSIKNTGVRQVSLADIDRDGDDDLIVLDSDSRLQWLENNGSNANNYLEVVIRADEDGKQTPRERCNMHGVGSLIELKAAGRYQAQIVRGTKTKFGLGSNAHADVMRVLWTNGIPNNVLDIRNRTTVYDQQNLGGSCPYLYAWNGEQFEFCTDCLWAAPIGLQFAQGVSAPTREWEYLKLDGRSIQPKDGQYVLQITEELWEAAYFDTVRLIAVDHPSSVDVFTNEKVGSADLAAHRIYTVENRHVPKRVLDQNGRDWSDTVAKRDQRFTKAWTRGYNQGLVEEHWLEFNMNHSSNPSDAIVLFLTGWVFPTCTSLNLAMTENPLKPPLKPPSIQVPNAHGEWQEVIPYAGFPGGKTKTIAIDLTGKFLCEDRRVRLVTNMELCWDEAFWTVGESKPRPELYQLYPLTLTDANLHYRGFSKLVSQPGNAPKQYRYDQVEVASQWPPMTGAFTQYGEVLSLLQNADDIQVVMGAGDELTVAFSAALPPVRDGWIRDFIIYNVGWDKDADLNTVHGQDVEPLPFRAMTRYPYDHQEAFPSSPQHLEFLERYQTRRQDAGIFWHQVRDTN